MIKEIRHRTKVAKEIVLQCDHCGKIYTRDYKAIYLDKQRHFCSKACTNEEKKHGGLICLTNQNTCLLKYGVANPFQDNTVKEKIKNTHFKQQGVENISQSSAIKIAKRNTCFNNFGVEVPLRSALIKIKFINTFLKNYGVSNPSQNPEFFNKAQQNMRGSHKTGYVIIGNEAVFYRSSYEEQFLLGLSDFVKDRVGVVCEPNVPVDYVFEGRCRKYFADYLVGYHGVRILFEIKPSKLTVSAQNISKFAAAREFVTQNNIKSFVILTEKELFNNFNLEKYFGRSYE